MPAPDEFFRQAFSGTPGVTTHPDFSEWTAFVQDEWHVRPNLTLNFGLRYDLQLIAKPTVKNPAPSLVAAGLDTSFLRTDKNNVAPRFGFAWAPWSSNRVVMRGGYGIFYAMTPSILTSRSHFQNGITVQTLTFSGGSANTGLIPSYPNTLCGVPDPSGAPPSCLPPTPAINPILILFAPNYTQPYGQQGSFGIEVELQKNLSVSVSYLWVKGTHLERARDINLAVPATPTNIGIAGTDTVLTYQKLALPRPIVGFDRIWIFESAASSTYHGLAVQVNKRLANHFQCLASYTLGKVIDDVPDQLVVNPGVDDFGQVSDPSNPHADRGPGANDQRHRLVASGIWSLNYADDLSSWKKAIFSGWEVSGILTAQSGQPYSGLVNFDLNNDGNPATDRTPGLGRNTFNLPARVSFDPRVTRNVALSERMKVQFIWEAFNVFNRANVATVRTTQYAVSTSAVTCGIAGTPCLVPQSVGLSAFGTPTSTSGPRTMQLSAKVTF